MTTAVVQHTIDICERLYGEMPPLVPKEICEDMRKAIEQARNNLTLSLNEIEDTLVFFGKKLWPYREAYHEFYDVYEGMLGEKFFVRRLTIPVKIKYTAYLEQGGSFRDLRNGRGLEFFTSEEKTQLCEAFVELERDLDQYTRQIIMSTDERKYSERVQEFAHILTDIESRLGALRQMAQKEGEHPELVAEIESQIQAFEHGLCLLGPRTEYQAVCNAAEHFDGRRVVINMHKSVF